MFYDIDSKTKETNTVRCFAAASATKKKSFIYPTAAGGTTTTKFNPANISFNLVAIL
jgi:hypothetical protein